MSPQNLLKKEKNKSLANFYEVLAESKKKDEKKNSLYHFSIYSHDKKDLLEERLEIQSQESSWQPLSSLSRKKRFGSFSLLRSPRGNKKSQDQFHFELYREDWTMEVKADQKEKLEEKRKVEILERTSKWKEEFYLS